jgi:hypothetical protein
MGYRDDVDTLYTRAMILQRELDAAKEQLAERDAELSRARGGAVGRAETSPGQRQLRDLPDPDDVLARLVTIPEYDEKLPRLPGLPPLKPLPMPNWTTIAERSAEAQNAPVLSRVERVSVLRHDDLFLAERVREGVASLTYEDLLLVAKIVDELTDHRTGMDERLRARLRWLASEIALDEEAR